MNLSTNVVNNFSRAIPELLDDESFRKQMVNRPAMPVGVCGWINSKTLLVYDNYDIWKVDILSTRSPVNVTNGYGKKHNTKLRFISEDASLRNMKYFSVLPSQPSLLLSAFNILNKKNGFFSFSIYKSGDPKMLGLYSCSIYWQEGEYLTPVRARNVNKWIVARSKSDEAPDLYMTSDFIKYMRLTHRQPQEEFNWLTTELYTYNQIDGTETQGVLYKPGDFNPNKKYPIIFNYYECKSQNLHVYINPEFANSEIEIPWFVSRGYLVFTPDIHYKVGKTGQSVCNSIVAAAKLFGRMAWVDSSRMGIAGQSFGGYETQYLVTHTSMFSAAVATSGVSDFISFYGQAFEKLTYGSVYGQMYNETGQFRIGATLWERPDLYIENSPIFKLDQVTTPILTMNNHNDPLVPFTQGIEFYTWSSTIAKRVWMLQYDEGKHGAGRGKNTVDYTIRSTQFFDHYLKGYPPPKWMTQGRPAKLKGIEDRFELDLVGSCGDSCKICKDKNYDMNAVLDVMNPNKKRE